MFTLIIFLIVISVLVFVHELGHFVVAKKSGMKVEEFGFGFPPRVASIRRGGTVYSLNAIPFGGFVRIYGEDGEGRRDAGSFGASSFWKKVATLVAGVAMNFLFACFLLIIANFLGLRVGIFDASSAARATNQQVNILDVAAGSPAQTAKLQSLDAITGFVDNGKLVLTANPEAVQTYAYSHAGQNVVMEIVRDGGTVEVPMHLRQSTGPNQGPIGVSLVLTGTIRYPWYEAFWRGFAAAGILFWGTLGGYWKLIVSLFVSGHLGADVAGPVGIATLTGQAARVGFSYLIEFVAMISVNLAVLNILPFPALDGGRLAMVVAEKFRGKPISHRVEATINSIGFAVLLALMAAVTVRDVVHFF